MEFLSDLRTTCFNTQPPEGGWGKTKFLQHIAEFQHTAARRRLVDYINSVECRLLFQHTAARRRLAHGRSHRTVPRTSFNTQPPEGGWGRMLIIRLLVAVFQHTAARRRLVYLRLLRLRQLPFQHTAARRRLAHLNHGRLTPKQFQHTAARRRLAI